MFGMEAGRLFAELPCKMNKASPGAGPIDQSMLRASPLALRSRESVVG
jgi:hypothetical protein